MARQLQDDVLIVASHNEGKVREIADLLTPWALTVKSAAGLGLAEPEETETTYKGNAALKALAAARTAGHPALADDSGFEVEAINNAPGLYSARWAGPDRDFSAAMEKVHQAVIASGHEDRRCRFVCALSLAWPDGHHETVEGRIEGEMVWPPRGDRGFGYDPIFQPLGHDRTFAEVDPDWKHSVSHRAVAFAALIDRCFAATPKRH
ncbi:MAG: RdgB/HAM1 family non-canonical purine NTP pyrophosphatase [Candidatus Puniceispirillales bacterium]